MFRLTLPLIASVPLTAMFVVPGPLIVPPVHSDEPLKVMTLLLVSVPPEKAKVLLIWAVVLIASAPPDRTSASLLRRLWIKVAPLAWVTVMFPGTSRMTS